MEPIPTPNPDECFVYFVYFAQVPLNAAFKYNDLYYRRIDSESACSFDSAEEMKIFEPLRQVLVDEYVIKEIHKKEGIDALNPYEIDNDTLRKIFPNLVRDEDREFEEEDDTNPITDFLAEHFEGTLTTDEVSICLNHQALEGELPPVVITCRNSWHWPEPDEELVITDFRKMPAGAGWEIVRLDGLEVIDECDFCGAPLTDDSDVCWCCTTITEKEHDHPKEVLAKLGTLRYSRPLPDTLSPIPMPGTFSPMPGTFSPMPGTFSPINEF